MKKIATIIVIIMIVVGVSASAAGAAGKVAFGMEPVLKNGQKWRIAYYEGGEYIDYQKIFTETIKGLMNLGWIKVSKIPKQTGEQTNDLWKWLSTQVQSDYIEFVADAHYSANWDDDLRKKTVEQIIARIIGEKDIDLLVAMGTWAGKDFANDRHETPTIVLSASDPLSAGIIKSVEDSGFDHLHATVDPFRFERQVRVFHEIIGFKKLGVAYENSVNGKSYAAIDVVKKVAEERKFEVVPCFTKSDISDSELAEKSVIGCFEKLSQTCDAIYVTQQGGVNRRSIPALVEIANQNHIPTFSQSGSEEVKYGFLVSISQAGFRYIGEFHAQTIAKVFNGAKPNQLDQLFEEPPKIAINMKTAEVIGYDPPVVLLGATDEIFNEINQPQ
ncbi:MAG: ABC transporter substrate binding protein [Desulfobacterales bacterium]